MWVIVISQMCQEGQQVQIHVGFSLPWKLRHLLERFAGLERIYLQVDLGQQYIVVSNEVASQEAFWGLLLPVTVHGRVSDIWRAYLTQKLLWDAPG